MPALKFFKLTLFLYLSHIINLQLIHIEPPGILPQSKAIRKEPKPAGVSNFHEHRTLKLSAAQAARPGAAGAVNAAAKQVSIVKLE